MNYPQHARYLKNTLPLCPHSAGGVGTDEVRGEAKAAASCGVLKDFLQKIVQSDYVDR